MGLKEIVTIVVLIMSLPLLVKLTIWASQAGSTPVEEHTQKGMELMTEAVKPWWMDPVVWLAGLGTGGAIIAVIFFVAIKEGGGL